MSPESETAYDPRYLEGIAFFNECEFFEAHEVWEDLWADIEGGDRRFFQGLIQVAVCLHHFGNGNLRGAKKLYYGCQTYLNDYRPAHQGCDVEKLIAELTTCCAPILEGEEPPPGVEIVPDEIPEIHLDPPA